MSDRTFRISRRRLLQIGSVAPLSALLMAPNATDEEIAAVAKKLPLTSENDLYHQAKDVDQVFGIHEKNFRSAVRVLFEYFAAGSEDAGVDVPDSGQAHRHLVLDVAYPQKNMCDEKSGVLIARRSPNWQNRMHATTVCAYLCGVEFAKAAPDFGDPASVKAAYATAYRKVEVSTTTLLGRARTICKDSTEDRDAKAFGAGC